MPQRVGMLTTQHPLLHRPATAHRSRSPRPHARPTGTRARGCCACAASRDVRHRHPLLHREQRLRDRDRLVHTPRRPIRGREVVARAQRFGVLATRQPLPQSVSNGSKIAIASPTRPGDQYASARLLRVPSVWGWSPPNIRSCAASNGSEDRDRLTHPTRRPIRFARLLRGAQRVRMLAAETPAPAPPTTAQRSRSPHPHAPADRVRECGLAARTQRRWDNRHLTAAQDVPNAEGGRGSALRRRRASAAPAERAESPRGRPHRRRRPTATIASTPRRQRSRAAAWSLAPAAAISIAAARNSTGAAREIEHRERADVAAPSRSPRSRATPAATASSRARSAEAARATSPSARIAATSAPCSRNARRTAVGASRRQSCGLPGAPCQIGRRRRIRRVLAAQAQRELAAGPQVDGALRRAPPPPSAGAAITSRHAAPSRAACAPVFSSRQPALDGCRDRGRASPPRTSRARPTTPCGSCADDRARDRLHSLARRQPRARRASARARARAGRRARARAPRAADRRRTRSPARSAAAR